MCGAHVARLCPALRPCAFPSRCILDQIAAGGKTQTRDGSARMLQNGDRRHATLKSPRRSRETTSGLRGSQVSHHSAIHGLGARRKVLHSRTIAAELRGDVRGNGPPAHH
eukprot:3226102-Prymnesium_polylepis.1